MTVESVALESMKKAMSRLTACIACIAAISVLVCLARGWNDSSRVGKVLPLAEVRANSAVSQTIAPRRKEGSSAAAATQDSNVGKDSNSLHQRARRIFDCIKLQNSRRRAEELLAIPTSALNPVQFASHDAALSKAEHDLDPVDSQAFCDHIGESEIKKQLYPALLSAAEAGDWDAATCYTIAPFDPTDDQLSEEALSTYRNAARKFIVEGMRRGDWRFVTLAELSVGDRTMRHPGQFKRSLFHRFITPDEKMRYGYVRLERLGATDDYANQLDAQLDAMAPGLSENDLQEMNRWAEEEYRINFADKPKIQEPPELCDLQ